MESPPAFEIEIQNSYGGAGARNYCVYSETPEISGGGTQAVDILRIVCQVVGPLVNGGRGNLSYKAQYAGFIGRKKEIQGKIVIEVTMERQVSLGSEGNNGTCLDAHVRPSSGALDLLPSTTERSPQGSFGIRCIDQQPQPHDVVVGLSQVFDGYFVPVAAVPYSWQVTYTIIPKGPVHVLRHDLAVRQVIPSNLLSSGFPVSFQGTQAKARVTEDNIGRFAVSMAGFGSTATTQVPQHVPKRRIDAN